MADSCPCRTRSSARSASHDVAPPLSALEDLKLIRSTIEQSVAFTAISGWGLIGVGSTALIAAWVAHVQPDAARWLRVWLAEAVVAVAISGFSIYVKAQRTGQPMFSGPARRAASGLIPGLIAGAVLTVALWRAGFGQQTVFVWLLVYGAAVVAGGTWSVRPVRWMGASFILVSLIAAFGHFAPDVLMAGGFGWLHIVFGFAIARRYGG
jgi:hypothetical protein